MYIGHRHVELLMSIYAIIFVIKFYFKNYCSIHSYGDSQIPIKSLHQL